MVLLANFKILVHRAMRLKPGTRSKFNVLFCQGVFQLQKDHRQPSTTPHIYIASGPTRFGVSGGDSNFGPNALEPDIVTTRPRRIPEAEGVEKGKDSNLGPNALEPGIVTTRPRRIPEEEGVGKGKDKR